jgi:hypothetical protein
MLLRNRIYRMVFCFASRRNTILRSRSTRPPCLSGKHCWTDNSSMDSVIDLALGSLIQWIPASDPICADELFGLKQASGHGTCTGNDDLRILITGFHTESEAQKICTSHNLLNCQILTGVTCPFPPSDVVQARHLCVSASFIPFRPTTALITLIGEIEIMIQPPLS